MRPLQYHPGQVHGCTWLHRRAAQPVFWLQAFPRAVSRPSLGLQPCSLPSVHKCPLAGLTGALTAPLIVTPDQEDGVRGRDAATTARDGEIGQEVTRRRRRRRGDDVATTRRRRRGDDDATTTRRG